MGVEVKEITVLKFSLEQERPGATCILDAPPS